ncbi:extracellular solute-binding protein family 5 [Coriobacterium glomerans PW2]|uniref:Extracellular solute-binding protein family 5 n=1 Tax=Coriobacterium glomerans (strain ATCC 49209 / DSM 20642 / JCM 10262 / PW2) TaxID=700015 RepID=F2N8G8_CORGP|nr:ABC transporter substrate-binding protein [Coriobacterium glomerans]AEB07351.1 extracellular solute-binding protein family 5 [Coriobacterium glomerans PW2]
MADFKVRQPIVGRRQFIGGTLAASALAALAACSPAGKGSGSTDGGGSSASNKISYFLSDPKAIDPYNLQEDQGTQVGHCLFDPLVTYDWDKKKVVALAAKDLPEISEDGLTYTFKLKEATFHNGDKVDSASFKRGWQRLVDPNMKTPGEIGYHLAPVAGYSEYLAGNAKEITGLTCPDDSTFVVTLSKKMADFIYVCTHPGLVPVPQAAIDEADDFLLAPIGNGPFKMKDKWVTGQYIEIERNDDYYGDKATIDGVYFSIQKSPETAFTEFESGNIDFTNIPTAKLKDIKDQYGASKDGFTVTPGNQVLDGTECSVYFLAANLKGTNEYLKDVNVRRAISMAINRKNIVETVLSGYGAVADGVIPSLIDDEKEGKWKYTEYDPKAAAKLLDDKYPAGDDGKRGITVTLNYNSGGGHEDIMTTIQSDLENIGIEVNQGTQEWAAYLTTMKEGSYDLGRMGWIADYPTIDNFIYPNFYSTADNNYSKYDNPEIDKAIDASRLIDDEDERKEALRKISAKIGDDMPLIPIYFYSHKYVGSKRLKKFYYSPQVAAAFSKAEIAK